MADDDTRSRPDWARYAREGDVLATSVVQGVTVSQKSPPGGAAPRRKDLSIEEYAAGIRANDRPVLARAITLIESNAPAHHAAADALLQEILPHAGRSVRIGITGVPGAGKSTFIERFGCMLCDEGRRVAVLAVDPSSSVSRGSILGDKTRMERLSTHPNGFIRPSPSGGTLGGVARRTRETMLLCEAAGYDVLLVETVGVGQSEVLVRSMVDFFLLLTITGAGDDLQNMKKGVMELADLIAINKADGDNAPRARRVRADLKQAVRYIAPATPGWDTEVLAISAREGSGIGDLWNAVRRFVTLTKNTGFFEDRRRNQRIEWLQTLIHEELRDLFFRNPNVAALLPQVETAIRNDTLGVSQGMRMLLREYRGTGE